jgi:(p)ppGpp synthase/HD superfamily hydrolase
MSLSPRFDTALTFASAHHRAQLRKGTPIPYLAHLLSVAALAIEHGATEDEAIAAVLHDAIEDQGVTFAELDKLFGRAVAEIVQGCSDTDVIPKPPWRARKEHYVAHVRTASASIRLVSMSDKLHNARSILADLRTLGDELWSRFTGGRDGSLWYYRALVDAYRDAGTTPQTQALLDELERTVAAIEQHRDPTRNAS